MISPEIGLLPLQISDLQGVTRALYNGLSWTMVLILISSGLSLSFGLMGVINFAHGELYAVGAYTGLVVAGLTGNFFVAILAAVLVGGVLGVVFERSIIKHLYGESHLVQFPATLGAAIIINELIIFFVGADNKALGIPSYFSGTFVVGGVTFGTYRLFLIMSGVIVIASIWLFLERTRYGMVITAAIDDKEMVQSMGYNLNTINTFIFALGSAFAALAGILIAPLFGIQIDMGIDILIIAFIVVIVGGLGSFQGVVVAGFLIGMSQSFGRIYLPKYSAMIPFVLMMFIILYRPQGIAGVREELG
jgi:branched-chain amino acid transport system permease protein